jgi:hypothetical protein
LFRGIGFQPMLFWIIAGSQCHVIAEAERWARSADARCNLSSAEKLGS